jgi:hypothetical protein
MRICTLALLLVGCSGSKGGDSAGAMADSGATDGGGTDGGTTDGGSSDGGTDEALNGTEPAVALEAPTFVATNRDGGARSREDLLGHPTVMWFYPAAGTFG